MDRWEVEVAGVVVIAGRGRGQCGFEFLGGQDATGGTKVALFNRELLHTGVQESLLKSSGVGWWHHLCVTGRSWHVGGGVVLVLT
jgi:hypothetical protein